MTWVHIGPLAVRAVPLSWRPVNRTLGSVGCCAMKLLHRQARPLFWLTNSPAARGARLRNTPPSHVHHNSLGSPGVWTSACTSECACVPIEAALPSLYPFP